MTASRFNRKEAEKIIDRGRSYLDRLPPTAVFPVIPGYTQDEIILSVLNHEVLRACETISNAEGFKDGVSHVKQLTIAVPGYDAFSDFGRPLMHMRLSYEIPYPDGWRMRPSPNPHSPFLKELQLWSAHYITLLRQVVKQKQLLQLVGRRCNTPGQWLRVLPNTGHVLDMDSREAAHHMKKRSAWPKDFMVDDEMLQDLSKLALTLNTALLLPRTTSEKAPYIQLA